MKQSTFSAVMANKLLTVMQGYTKGIRFTAILTVLFTVGVGSMLGADTWELVTNASTLKAGDELVIVSDGTNDFVAGDISSSSVMASVSGVTISSNKTISSLPNGTVILTLGESSGAWTLTNNSGKKLGATAVKKVAWGSGTTTWSISISNNNATIQSTTSSYGRFLYNVSSPRFTTYTSNISTSMLLPQLYRKKASCTAPESVSISGEWGYFAGETISLKATPTGGGTPTGYQWYKNGTAISGATSSTYSKSNCTDSDAGNYTCKVSTGATCSTTSSAFVLRVYSLQNYTGGTTTHNFTRVGTTKTGTVEVVLTNNKQYEFIIFAGNSLYLGNNGTINADISNWVFETGTNNVKLNSGLGGTFIFTIDYSSDSSKPKISVSYPRKTIYMNCGNTSWCDSDPAFFAHTWGNGDYDVKLTQHPCDETVYLAEDIPAYNSYIIFTRQKPGSTQLVWSGDNFWNQSEDITIGTNDLFTCTGWNNNKGTFSGGTYTPPTYTITFSGNSNTGGSMTNVSGIPCEGSTTLATNGYTRTGYTFTNWKTNVAVTANSSSVDANGSVADKATISNITSNITLTAQWKANTYTITYKDGGNASFSGTHESGYPTTHTYGTETILKNATKIGYTFGGWYKESACTNKVTSLGATAYTANITLYAKWTPNTYTITLNANGGSGGTESVTATYNSSTLSPAITNPTKTGYTFTGWYSGSGGTGNKVIGTDGKLVVNVSGYTGANGVWTATENKNLYAGWTINSYTLTWNVNGGNALTGTYTKGSVNYGAAITKPENPTRTGYTFLGWHDGTNIVEPATKMPDHNLTYTAQWKIITYTIKWNVDGSVTNETVNHGAKVAGAPNIDPNNLPCGQKFAGWTDQPITGTTDDEPNPLYKTAAEIPAIEGDITFYAVFADYANE